MDKCFICATYCPICYHHLHASNCTTHTKVITLVLHLASRLISSPPFFLSFALHFSLTILDICHYKHSCQCSHSTVCMYSVNCIYHKMKSADKIATLLSCRVKRRLIKKKIKLCCKYACVISYIIDKQFLFIY